MLKRKIAGLVLTPFIFLALLATSGQAVYQRLPVAPAETIVDSDITTDTTWTLANSPYHIVTNLNIMPGATLTIEPGVQVLLDPKLYIHVWDGASLIAKGTPSQHIVFDRYSKRWKKIWFHEGSSSYLRYVEVRGAGADSSDENTSIHYQGTGSHVLNWCQIVDGDQFGVVAEGSVNLTIAGTLLAENAKVDLVIDESANVVVTGSTLDKRALGQGRTIWLRSAGSSLTINDSNILTPGSEYGIQNDVPTSVCINAENNWWGASNGPYDGSWASDKCGSDSNNGSGSWVTNGVDYRPWRTSQASLAGITSAPNVTFTVSPDPLIPQPPGTVYTFDASGTTDAEDYTFSLEVCWDWENDGTCDTSWTTTKTATHSFSTGGWHTVRLVVRDTDGLTGEATRDILAGYPPTATFTITQTTWAQAVFDGSGSSDVETPQPQLEALWDWEGDGTWDTGVLSVTQIQTHTYPHLGRYWPTLQVKDTDSLTDIATQPLNIIPPAVSQVITGSGGTLTSVDATCSVDIYTSTVSGDVISNGLIITHTPWLTAPFEGLPGEFTYYGFNLTARTLSDQPIQEISGTYTITVEYDYTYLLNVLGLPSFEGQIKLYRWNPDTSSWELVSGTLDLVSNRLVATTNAFGDFALVMDIRRVYMPIVVRSY
ncbi:MAG TPA: hypothetical protein G4O00_03265 [Thermoflexia bacterium]|jgi:hypothetical protein|nr:hypothetical protein [Thermoflexia bacterium]